jgi:hypothetical protein
MELYFYQCPFPVCFFGSHRDDIMSHNSVVEDSDLLGCDTALLVRPPYIPFCAGVFCLSFFLTSKFLSGWVFINL